MDGQLQVPAALEACTLAAHYEWGSGWRLVVRRRTVVQTWEDVDPEVFDYLTTEELGATVNAVMDRMLGL